MYTALPKYNKSPSRPAKNPSNYHTNLHSHARLTVFLVQVSVRVNSTSDGEFIILREAGIDSSVFTGRLTTATGTAVRLNNVFTVAAERDIVTIAYADQCPSATRPPAVAPVSALPGVLVVASALLAPGTSLAITVTDGVLNADTANAETYAQVSAL